MRLRTRAADGSAVHLDLPTVHILHHDAVPMLIVLQSHKRLNILVDTALDTIYTGSLRTPIPCRLRRGHLILPPPLLPTTAAADHYTRDEMQLAHRQFGHASVAAITRAFPRDTFSAEDVAHLKTVRGDLCALPTTRTSPAPPMPRPPQPPPRFKPHSDH